MSEINNLRRYYLLKRLFARMREEDSEGIWKGKQEAQPGTALPSDFPLRELLVECGYTTREDLDGADVDELVEHIETLTEREAETVLDAADKL